MERLTSEFLSLVQTTESVNEITDKFLERSLFCPEYIANERMKMYRYAEVLKPEIREFVVMARCTDFQQMHEMARARALELERQGKRKKEEQTQTHQPKKFKLTGQKSEARRDPPKCAKCGKPHSGECRMGVRVCDKCGKSGHLSRDCKVTAKLCFKCFQPGHFASECPVSAGSAQNSGHGTGEGDRWKFRKEE